MKIFTSVVSLLAMAATASPVDKAAAADVDLVVLNFALTLEHLEAAFYRMFLTKFSESQFQAEGFTDVRDQIKIVSAHEDTHVQFLNNTINTVYGAGYAKPACEFNLPFTTVKDALSLAAVFEKVGVSAYDGAIHLITAPAYLTAGATIATVEARHSAALNIINKAGAIPNAFDTPLGINSIISLISPFVVSCPFELPGKAFPSPLTAPASSKAGSDITVSYKASKASDSMWCNFAVALSQYRTPLTVTESSTGVYSGSCAVPDLKGNCEAVVTVVSMDKDVGLSDDSHVLAGPAFLKVD